MLTVVPPYDSLDYVEFINGKLSEGGSMTNESLVLLHQAMPRFMDIGNTKFGYAIMKNKRLIEQEVKNLEKARVTDPDWKKFNDEREVMAKEHCEKDEKGKPVIVQSPAGPQYKITAIEEFETLFKELKEKHKEAIEKQDKLNDEFEKLLETESTIQFYKISQSELPDTLSGKDLELLECLISE